MIKIEITKLILNWEVIIILFIFIAICVIAIYLFAKDLFELFFFEIKLNKLEKRGKFKSMDLEKRGKVKSMNSNISPKKK